MTPNVYLFLVWLQFLLYFVLGCGHHSVCMWRRKEGRGGRASPTCPFLCCVYSLKPLNVLANISFYEFIFVSLWFFYHWVNKIINCWLNRGIPSFHLVCMFWCYIFSELSVTLTHTHKINYPYFQHDAWFTGAWCRCFLFEVRHGRFPLPATKRAN